MRHLEEVTYSAHRPATIPLFATAIRQRRITNCRHEVIGYGMHIVGN